MPDRLFEGFVNPLAFLDVDSPWVAGSGSASAESTLKMLCTPGISGEVDHVIERYRQISVEPNRLFIAPHEENILAKLIWPLRHAKTSYMVGNYFGTVALCGMVAEMAAILFFEIMKPFVQGQSLDEALQRDLFGSKFERLGQERRISVLRAYNAIDGETTTALTQVKDLRRRYLHFFSQEVTSIETDAVAAYCSTVTIVVKLIGQEIEDGKIILNPRFAKYLEDKGLIQDFPHEE